MGRSLKTALGSVALAMVLAASTVGIEHLAFT
jgi:hypothetical protein